MIRAAGVAGLEPVFELLEGYVGAAGSGTGVETDRGEVEGDTGNLEELR